MEDLSVIRTVKSIVDQTQSDQKNILETVQEMCGHQFVIAKEIGQKVPNDSKLQKEMSQLLTLVRAVQSSTDASNMFVKNKISAILALVKEALNKGFPQSALSGDESSAYLSGSPSFTSTPSKASSSDLAPQPSGSSHHAKNSRGKGTSPRPRGRDRSPQEFLRQVLGNYSSASGLSLQERDL